MEVLLFARLRGSDAFMLAKEHIRDVELGTLVIIPVLPELQTIMDAGTGVRSILDTAIQATLLIFWKEQAMTAEELVEKVARMFSTDFGEGPDADDVMMDVRTMDPVSNWTLYVPIARVTIAMVVEECAQKIELASDDWRAVEPLAAAIRALSPSSGPKGEETER